MDCTNAGPKTLWARTPFKLTSPLQVNDQNNYKLFLLDCICNVIDTGPPVIQQHPTTISVNEGEEAELSCSFSGEASPITTVTWFKDNKPTADFVTPVQSAHNSLLRLTATTNSAGNYFCVVETIGNPPVVSQVAALSVRGIVHTMI